MALKQKAISGVIWTFSQQFSVQIITFLVQIILARLLMPKDFGMIAMLTIFIAIGQMLMDSGMTTSLIRSKNITQTDYSTVFFTNMMISSFMYLVTFIAAPYIAGFYEIPMLRDILRVLALTFVIKSFVGVHVAKLTKELDFKTQMKLQIPSSIIGGIVGIILAMYGYGVWSLVWLQLSQAIVFTIQNWIFIKWRPSFIFDWENFKYHFLFGYKLTLSSLLDTVYNNLYNIFIGKYFSPALLGFFTQAETLRLLPVKNLTSVISKVTFPVFSAIQTKKALKIAYQRTLKVVLFAVAPTMFCLILVAEPLVLLLFGEKWLPTVDYFQILCIASIVRPISTYNLNILKVQGRSDLYLMLEIIKKTIGVVGFFLVLPYGILALVWLLTVTSFFFVFLNAFVCGRLIDYSFKEQIIDIIRPLGIGLLAFIIIFLIFYCCELHGLFNFLKLIILGSLYFLTYLGLSYFLDKPILNEIKNLLKK